MFGVVDLEEPIAKSKTGTVADPYVMNMRILNAVPDAAGETPIIPAMDFSDLDSNGYVKWEHDPFITTIEKSGAVSISSFPTAKNIIGGVFSRSVSADNKHVNILSRLFPYMEETKHVLDLQKSIKEWNELYPNKRKAIQCSVEGGYLTKSKDGKYTAKVSNVAITTQAMDEGTWMEQATKANVEMAKSLMAGAATSIAGKTDGAALVKEDLEGNIKSKTYQEKAMKKFMSRKDAETYHKSKGLKGDELKSAVEKEFEEEKKEKEDCTKSITGALATVSTNVTLAKSLLADALKKFDTQSEDIMTSGLKLKKSMGALKAGESVDGAEFMAQSALSVIAVSENNLANNQVLAKSLLSITEILSGIVDLQKSQQVKLDIIGEDAANVAERLASVAIGLRMAKSAEQTNNLSSLEVAQRETPAEDETINIKHVENYLANRAEVEEKQMNKSVAASYWEAAKSVKINGFEGLSKSIADEVRKKFSQAAN